MVGHTWSAIVAVPILEIFRMLVLSVPYARQGFFCHDEEIRYPLYPDTISSDLMFAIFFAVALTLVVSVEYTLIRHVTKRNRRMLAHDKGALHPGLVNIFFFMVSLSCSVLSTSVIMNLGKRTASKLRPNFLAVCQPNLTELCPPNTFRYVEDYVCYGKYKDDEFFSFPSGHAAHATQFAVFMIYYLQKRCKFPEPFRSFLQFVIFLFSYFIALSRVRDRKHRLSDVVGGGLIGLATGLFFMCFVLRHFKHNRYRVQELLDVKDPESLSKSTVITPTIVVHTNLGNSGASYQRKEPSTVTSEYGSLNVSSSSENIYEKIPSSSALHPCAKTKSGRH